MYIPLLHADNEDGNSAAHLIHESPDDLTQMSVTQCASPAHIAHPTGHVLQQQHTQSTPTSSTCSEEDNSEGTEEEEEEEDVTKMVEHVLRIQAWWRGCATRCKHASYAKREKAAIVIQSVWRGFRSRRCDPKVMWARSELKRHKMEAYVVLLLHQLRGCRQQVAHNAQVIQLQEETLQTLMVEVKAIQDWQDGEKQHRQENAAGLIQKHWRGFVARRKHPDIRRVLSKHAPSMSYSLYQRLRHDVEVLKAKIRSLGVEGRDSFEGARERYERLGFLHKDSREERVTPCVQTLSQSSVASQTDVLDTARATAVPSAECVEPIIPESTAMLYPPTNLHMSHYSASCVQLTWEGADCVGVLGYNVYVNGVVEGRVGPTRRKAYLDGLDAATTYSISVRALYKEGESQESNPILASVKMQPSAATKASKRLQFSLPSKELDSPVSNLVFDHRTEGERPQAHPKKASAKEGGILTQTTQTYDTSEQLLLQSSSADDTVGESMHLHTTSSSGGLEVVSLMEGTGDDTELPGLGSVSPDVATTSGLQEADGISPSDAKQAEATPVKGRDLLSPVRSSSSDSDTTDSGGSTGQSDGCLTTPRDGSGTSPRQDAVEDLALTCQEENMEKPLLVPNSCGTMPLDMERQWHQQANNDAVSSTIDTKPQESPHSISPHKEEGQISPTNVITVNLDWGELFDAASPIHSPIPLPTIPLPSVNLPHFSEYSHGSHVSVVNTTSPVGLPPPQQRDHPSAPTDTDQVLTGRLTEGQPRVTTPTSMV